jgi:hypothetical protein
MPKTTFDEAVQASTRRRARGLNVHTTSDGTTTALAQVADILHRGASSQSTTAVGLIGSTVYIARQGGRPDLDEGHWTLMNAFGPNYTFVNVNDIVQSETGLHAEMMIIRYIVEQHNIGKGALAARGLKIGVTKGCCLDCAGWLNRHGIPHNKPPEDEEAKASNQWVHPLTRAVYMGNKSLNYYRKGSKSLSLYS